MMRKNGKKIKFALAGILAAGVLAACGSKAEAAMTQPIAAESLSGAAVSEAAATKTAAAGSAQTEGTGAAASSGAETTSGAGAKAAFEPSGDLETDLANYSRLKAEETAIETEIGKLEASFRVGSVAETDFRSKKQELIAQENELERQEDILEHAVDLAYYQAGQETPQGDVKELLSRKQEVERSQHENELAQDQLKNDYWNDKITRDDFVSQLTEKIRQEEELDRQEEVLEDTLERLGWDD